MATVYKYLEPVSRKAPFAKRFIDGGDWIPPRNCASLFIGQVVVQQGADLADLLALISIA
jgi:hypothetical protein